MPTLEAIDNITTKAKAMVIIQQLSLLVSLADDQTSTLLDEIERVIHEHSIA